MPYRIVLLILLFPLWCTAQEITYYDHIRPIIAQHCTSCHRQKGTAPFDLTTFEEVKKRAKTVKLVTEKGYMPPWKANPAYSHFANERILPDSAILLIQKWVESGSKEGKRNGEKKASHSNLTPKEKPELVLKMKEPFIIPGDNKQHFYCYKIPFELEGEKPVKAIMFVPGNKTLVHHASYQILTTSPTAPIFHPPFYFEYNTQLNHVENERDFNILHLIDPNSSFIPKIRFHTGWLPGTGKHEFPKGVGFTMPQRGVLLIRNLHYAATPVERTDQSEVHIYFAEKPIERVLEFAAFKPNNVNPIIPKDSTVTYTLSLKIGSDMSLLTINPHMHKLGKYFKAYAITPQRDTIRLLEIMDWDFNWQEFYRFKKLLKIPKGSMLHAEATYDNRAQNPNNPNHPPIDVFFERGNMDDDQEEMMRVVFMYLPYREGDEDTSLEFHR